MTALQAIGHDQQAVALLPVARLLRTRKMILPQWKPHHLRFWSRSLDFIFYRAGFLKPMVRGGPKPTLACLKSGTAMT